MKYEEKQHGSLDNLLYQAQKCREALEVDIDVQAMLTRKPMFEEQLNWLAQIKMALDAAQALDKGNAPMDYVSSKIRLKNQEATPEQIFKKICHHLALDSVKDGDEDCRAVKQRAFDELPHALGQLAAEGFPLYYHSVVTSWQGLNFELYRQLGKIADRGDPTPNMISTFMSALQYIIVVYCKAYKIAHDDAREQYFREALVNLVASYQLYPERRPMQEQRQAPIII